MAYFSTKEGKKRGLLTAVCLLQICILFSGAAYAENGGKKRTGYYSAEEKNSDGSFTREFHLDRINYKAADGSFKEIKKDISAVSDGSFENRENDFKTFFPASHGAKGIMYERNGNELSWELKAVSILNQDGTHSSVLSKKSPAGKNFKNRLSYGGVFNNIDDMYVIGSGRVKNNLILNTLPAAGKKQAEFLKVTGEFVLPKGAKVFVSGSEVQGGTETAEGFEIRLVNGESFVVEKAYVYENFAEFNEGDSRREIEGPPESMYGKYILKVSVGRIFLTLLVDYSWLSEPSRKYPVCIDPTVSLKGPDTYKFDLAYDAEIRSTSPVTNFGTITTSLIGKSAPTGTVYRTLIRFSEVDSIPATATVKSAILKLYTVSYLSGAPEDYIELRPVTQPWIETQVTWNNAATGVPWALPGGDFTDEYIAMPLIRAGGFVRWDQFNVTSIVEQWVKGRANYGFILKCTPQREASTTLSFGSDYNSYEATSENPVLKVTYYYGKDGIAYTASRMAANTGLPLRQYYNISFPYSQTSPSYEGGLELPVGGDSVTYDGPFRSFISFDDQVLPRNVTVNAASVNLSIMFYYNGASTVNMHRVTAPWEEKGLSWVSRTAQALWSNPGGDYDPAPLSSVAFSSNPPYGYYKWELPPDLVEKWIEGTEPNNGVMFKMSGEGTADGFSFIGYDVNDDEPAVGNAFGNIPRMDITYTAASGYTAPEIIKPSGSEYVDKGILIKWRWGSQSSLPDPFNLTYRLEYSPDDKVNWYLIADTAAKANMYYWDTSALAPGSLYWVRISAFDGTSYSALANHGNPFVITHGATHLKVLNASAAPVSVQAGQNITVVMEVANTYFNGPFRITPTALTYNSINGGGALINSINPVKIIGPHYSSWFTWVYTASSPGTVVFDGRLAALSGDGNLGPAVNYVDPDAPTKTSSYISNSVVILASTPSPTPTVTPTFTPAATFVTGTGMDWVLAINNAAFNDRYGHASVSYNGYMWVIAGGSGGVYRNDVWRSTNGIDWELVTGNAGFAPRYGCRAAVFNAGDGPKIYMMGGYDGTNYMKDVWKSGDGKNWTLLTHGAAYGSKFMSGFISYNNKLWVLGGDDGTTAGKDVWSSVNGADWVAVTKNAAFGQRTYWDAAVFNGEMWVAGGTTNGTTFQPETYHSSDGIVWTAGPLLPLGVRHHKLLGFKGRLYSTGGFESPGAYSNRVQSTDGAAAWANVINPAPWGIRGYHTFIEHEDKMFVIGGFNGTGITNVWQSPPTPIPCDLDIGGTVTLTGGNYNLCSVRVRSGATLYIAGSVTITVSGDFRVDAGGIINGDNAGFPGGAAEVSGTGPGGGLAGTASNKGGGGGGYGGAGGNGQGNNASGGVVNGDPVYPVSQGSGGGGAAVQGGNGGACLLIYALSGKARIDGTISMNGGTFVSALPAAGSGGGSGGTVHIRAHTIEGSGIIRASGGKGQDASSRGGGGGGGGRINLCYSDIYTYTGSILAGGGAAGLPAGLAGITGTLYSCAGAGLPLPMTMTYTPTPYLSPTPTFTITNTETPEPPLYGNRSEMEAVQGYRLNNSSYKMAYSFSPDFDMTVATLRIFVTSELGAATFEAGIQGDLAGKPSGSYIGFNSVTMAVNPGSWNTFDIGAVSLFKGSTYHIVIQSSNADTNNYADFAYSLPNHKIIPRNQYSDPAAWVLWHNGTSWITVGGIEGAMPVFVIDELGTKEFGNPYCGYTTYAVHSNGDTDISNDAVIGEEIIWEGPDTAVTDFSSFVRRYGSPSEALRYRIYNESDKVTMTAGVLADQASVTTVLSWHTAPVTGVTLQNGKIYRFFIYADQGGTDSSINFYESVAGRVVNPSSIYTGISYGGINRKLIVDSNGGMSFTVYEDEDFVFDFTGGAALTFTNTPTITVTATATPTATPSQSPTAQPTLDLNRWPECGYQVAAGSENETPFAAIQGSGGNTILLYTRDFTTYNNLFGSVVDINGMPVSGGQAALSAFWQNSPAAVADGSGGAVIVWADYRNGAYDIYAQRIDSSFNRLWGDAGVPVCTAINFQGSPKVIRSSDGGFITAWIDYRPGASTDIYAQKLNAAGVPQWTADGVAVCTAALGQSAVVLATDTVGGAYIAWSDLRAGGGNTDVYIQRADSSGSMLWTADGVQVTSDPAGQSVPGLVPDGAGSAVVAWEDMRSGNSDIYAQKYNATGTALWTAGGKAVCTDPAGQFGLVVKGNGGGGAVLAWEDERSGTRDIYYDSLDSSGNGLASDGIAVCTAAGNQSNPVLETDPAGIVYLSWADMRDGTYMKVYAQKFNASGVQQWGINGHPVCTGDYDQSNQQIVKDGLGGAVVFWGDFHSGPDMNDYAIRLNLTAAVPTPTFTRTATVTPTNGPAPYDRTVYFGHQSVYASLFAYAMDSALKQYSFKFTARENKTVNEIRLYFIGATGSVPFYTAELQADNGSGEPDGTPIASTTWVPVNGWNTRAVTGAVTAGQVYHIVIKHSSGVIDAANFISVESTNPLHGYIPYDQFQDPSINTLGYDGAVWTTQGRMPLFVLGFSDATYYGNAYASTSSNRFIYGAGGGTADDIEQAQYFTVNESFNVNRVGLYCRRTGTPADNLYYELYDVTNSTVVSSGMLAGPGINTAMQWNEANMPGTVTLWQGRAYRLSFKSPGSMDSTNCYIVSTPLDITGAGLTFDGNNSYYQGTANGGSTWSSAFNTDLNFRLILSGAPTATFTRTVTVTPSATATDTPSCVENSTWNFEDGTVQNWSANLSIGAQTVSLSNTNAMSYLCGRSLCLAVNFTSGSANIAAMDITPPDTVINAGEAADAWIYSPVAGLSARFYMQYDAGWIWADSPAVALQAGTWTKLSWIMPSYTGIQQRLGIQIIGDADLNGCIYIDSINRVVNPSPTMTPTMTFTAGASPTYTQTPSMTPTVTMTQLVSCIFDADAMTAGLWHFDEGTGNTIYDSSINASHGMVYGASWVQGKYGTGLYFDGVNDFAEILHSPVLNPDAGSFTVEFWIKTSQSPASNISVIQKFNRPFFDMYHMGLSSFGGIYSYFGEGDDSTTNLHWDSDSGTGPVNNGAWRYVAIIFNRTTNLHEIYIDGSMAGATAFTPDADPVTNIAPLVFGGDASGYFNGVLDEVRISSGVRSAAEISAYWACAAGATPTMTVTATSTSTACVCEKNLGNETVGGSSADISGRIHVNRYYFYSGTDSNASGIMVYVSATNGTAKMRAAIYHAAGMNHGMPITESGDITPVTGWNFIEIPDITISSLLFPQGVLLAFNTEPGIEIAYDNTAMPPDEHQISINPVSYGPFPALSTDLNAGNTRKYSAYIIYCPVDCDVTPTVTETATETPVYTPTVTATMLPELGVCDAQGNTHTGTYTDNTVTYNSLHASRFYLNPGILQNIAVHAASGAGGNISAAIYADNAGVPDALLAAGGAKAMINGWNMVPLTYGIVLPGYYWLAFASSVDGVSFSYDTDGVPPNSENRSWPMGPFPGWPGTWGTDNPGTRYWSIYADICAVATPTITPTVTPTVTHTVTQSVTATVTPTVTQSVTATVTQTVSETITQTATQTVTETVTETVTATATPTVTQTVTGTVTPTVTETTTETITQTSTQTVTETATETVTATATPTVTQTVTGTVTPTVTETTTETITQTATQTVTETVTGTVTKTVTGTATPTVTATVTPTVTQTGTPTATESITPTVTPTFLDTLTVTPTVTQTGTDTATPTVTATVTKTISPTVTGTATMTVTVTVTATVTQTVTETVTQTVTLTVTETATATVTATNTPSVTETATGTITGTHTPTVTETVTGTITDTVTPTITQSITATVTPSVTPTGTGTHTPTVTETSTSTVTQTPADTATDTPTATPTLSVTETSSVTDTPTYTVTPTESETATLTQTPSATQTATPTVTATGSHTATPSYTVTETQTASPTESATRTATQTATLSLTPTPTWTDTPTPEPTFTRTSTMTATPTSTESPTHTITETPTITATFTATPTPDVLGFLDKNHADAGAGETLTIRLLARYAGDRAVVKIYNLTGERIRNFGELTAPAAGWNNLTWDLRNDAGKTVGRGMYFIYIERENRKELLKVFIVK